MYFSVILCTEYFIQPYNVCVILGQLYSCIYAHSGLNITSTHKANTKKYAYVIYKCNARQENTRTHREPGSTALIKANDHYTGLGTTRLNKTNIK